MPTQERFEGNYVQWLGVEFKKINLVAAMIWFFGIGFQTALLVTNPITWQAFVTYLATVVGLGCTVYMMVGAPINGLLGLINVFGFVTVNLFAHHWWSVVDQIIFACAIDIPLMMKWRTWGQDFGAKVRKLHLKGWMVTILSIVVEWGILFQVARLLKDSQPAVDALVLAFGATASILCVMHVSNTYTLWLAEDVVNVLLWFYALKDGYSPAALPMLISTLMYTATAIYGQFFSVWHKAGNANGKIAVEN